jgi:hypothetical protein
MPLPDASLFRRRLIFAAEAGRLILDLVLIVLVNRIGGRWRGLPMLRWLEYDAIAVAVLFVGIGVLSWLALSI